MGNTVEATFRTQFSIQEVERKTGAASMIKETLHYAERQSFWNAEEWRNEMKATETELASEKKHQGRCYQTRSRHVMAH